MKVKISIHPAYNDLDECFFKYFEFEVDWPFPFLPSTNDRIDIESLFPDIYKTFSEDQVLIVSECMYVLRKHFMEGVIEIACSDLDDCYAMLTNDVVGSLRKQYK